MNLFCCQFDIAWEAVAVNHARVEALLRRTALPRGSLVVLPEMFSTGFTMNLAACAEGEPSLAETFLVRTAREFGVYVAGGVVRRRPDGRGANQAVVFSPEGCELGRYTKNYTFTPGGESEHYAAGQEVVTFGWQGFTVAPFICYDLRFPELFRTAVRRGTQLFLVMANWPATRSEHWVTLLKARAIENQTFLAGVNRCGQDPRAAYGGGSMIVGPRGEVLAAAGEGEQLLGAELAVDDILGYRREFPVLQDMRLND